MTLRTLLAAAFGAAGWFLAASGPLGAAELIIKVVGLETGLGVVRYAIYDRADHFPTREGAIVEGKVAAKSDGVRISLSGLKPGSYAVAVYHDENGNDSFDKGLFGYPLEKYGFSNDASGFFSAPSFKAARFELGAAGRHISITLTR